LLPETLRALIERSQKLHGKVRRLDTNIHNPVPVTERPIAANPVERQLGLLKAAFGAERI
jgi:regulator of CtrA degradation